MWIYIPETQTKPFSTLIAIINPNLLDLDPYDYSGQVVQFSHYSVKEFLTSSCLESSGQSLSRFYISPEPAHTILVQTCLSTLLQLPSHWRDNRSIIQSFPLTRYAAHNWINHAQVDGVASHVQTEMEYLFDPKLLHFESWVEEFDYLLYVRPKMFPLSYAAFYGFNNLVTHLVTTSQQDPSATDSVHGTALQAAIKGGHHGIAQFLVGHGANVDQKDYRNQTLLFCASASRVLDIIQSLLKLGADVNCRNGPYYVTPLHVAVRNRYSDAAQLLLDWGADMNAGDISGDTPLHMAASFGDSDVTQLLLTYGGDVNPRNWAGSTPLHQASTRGHDDVVQTLINFGADINASDNWGAPPLYRASQCGDFGMARLLLTLDADVNARDSTDSTPLHKASELGEIEVVQLLLDNGADIEACDNQGVTSLRKALRSKRLYVLRLFLERGADVNTRDATGSTPLHDVLKMRDHTNVAQLPLHRGDIGAVYKGHLNVASLLLMHGAEPNACDARGWTPLHLASIRGYLEVVNMLLDRGANANLREEHGQTPLYLAVFGGHADTARTLIAHGADVDAQDNQGRTPFSVALERGNRKLARLLSDTRSEP